MNILSSIILLDAPNMTEQFLIAAAPMLKNIVKNCLQFIPLMLFVHVLITLVKTYFGDMRIDPSAIIKVIAIWICLAAYEQIFYALNDATFWFNGLAGIYSGDDIMQSLNKLSETGYLKEHTKEFSFPNVKVPFDDMTSFFTWLILAVENGLSMVVRLFIERIRGMLLAFIMVCGPVAFTIATIPGFGGTIGHWFRIFFSTSLWGLTLSILDAIMVGFIQNFTIPTGSTLSEASAVLDLLVVNGAIILMYLSVPLLTSFYIGSAASASFLSAAQGLAGSGMAYAGGFAQKSLDSYRKDREKRRSKDRSSRKQLPQPQEA